MRAGEGRSSGATSRPPYHLIVTDMPRQMAAAEWPVLWIYLGFLPLSPPPSLEPAAGNGSQLSSFPSIYLSLPLFFSLIFARPRAPNSTLEVEKSPKFSFFLSTIFSRTGTRKKSAGGGRRREAVAAACSLRRLRRRPWAKGQRMKIKEKM